jgi:hypothetical protein
MSAFGRKADINGLFSCDAVNDVFVFGLRARPHGGAISMHLSVALRFCGRSQPTGNYTDASNRVSQCEVARGHSKFIGRVQEWPSRKWGR